MFRNIAHPLAGWHFELEAPDDQKLVVLDQQERPMLIFGGDRTNERNKIYLEALVYYLTEKKVLLGDVDDYTPNRRKTLKRIANILKTYLPQVENFLCADFEKRGKELVAMQEQYVRALIH